MRINLTEDNPIELLASGFDAAPVVQALKENASLWNEHRMRTADTGPHRDTSDIWVRCLDWEIMRDNPTAFNSPHDSSWYPAAQIPAIKNAVLSVLSYVGGLILGGVLITKIPAGKSVFPHIDAGWHARAHYKVALQIAADERQEFCFERKRLVTKAGDLFAFENAYTHWITNPSDTDRITLICCIRVHPTGRLLMSEGG